MNRFSRAVSIMLGRDKETPGVRAFRHERERIMISLFLQALPHLCLVLAMILLLTGSITIAFQVLVYSLLVFALIQFLINLALKWHQNKYGGD